MKKIQKTNAMRFLDQHKVEYEAHTYEHKDGDPVDGVFGDPFLEAGHGTGELFKIGQLEIFRRQVPEEYEGHQTERVQVRGRTLQPEFRIRQRHFPGAWAFGRLALHDGLAHGVPLGVGVGSALGKARLRRRG